MNDTELRLLVERFHTGDLNPAEEKTLEKMLEDPSARRLFVQDMTLLAALRSVLKVENSKEQLSTADRPKPVANLRVVPAKRSGTAKRRRLQPATGESRSRWSRIGTWMAAAAVLLITCGLAVAYWIGSRSKTNDLIASNPQTNEVIAGKVKVADLETVQIADGSLAECGSGAPAKIRLTDGSILELEPSSAALLRNRLIDLRSGQGTFHIAKSGGEFKVVTCVGLVTVLGTVFTVDLQPKVHNPSITAKPGAAFTMTVSVGAGSVGVDYDAARTVLQTGQRQTFGADPVPVPIPPPVAVVTPPAPVLPPEFKSFEGMVTGKVVSVSTDSIVITLNTGSRTGDTRNMVKGNLIGKAVQVVVKDVQGLPKLMVDDFVYCNCKEVNGQLVSSKIVQVKASKHDANQDDTF